MNMCLTLFFHDPPPTEIYTLSLHDALPISSRTRVRTKPGKPRQHADSTGRRAPNRSEETRLNSSHVAISYAVFCLKKKTKRIKLIKNTENNGKRTEEKAKLIELSDDTLIG